MFKPLFSIHPLTGTDQTYSFMSLIRNVSLEFGTVNNPSSTEDEAATWLGRDPPLSPQSGGQGQEEPMCLRTLLTQPLLQVLAAPSLL